MSAVKLPFWFQLPVTRKVAENSHTKNRKKHHVHYDERVVCPALLCLQKTNKKPKNPQNFWSTMATRAGFREGNPPHDLFLAHEKSGDYCRGVAKSPRDKQWDLSDSTKDQNLFLYQTHLFISEKSINSYLQFQVTSSMSLQN